MKHSNKTREIQKLLKELRISHLESHYLEIAKQAVQEKWDYETQLLEMLTVEYEGRKVNRMDRYQKLSKLPLFKRFESFETKSLEPDLCMKINTLKRGDFIDRQENILIFGKPGTGKTHLASALGHELIMKGKKVYFSLCSTLVQDLLKSKETFALPNKLKQLSRFDAIIIDEIGYIQQSRDEMEVLFTLLADRYEKGSIIITSNLPFSKWDQVFKDKMLAAAAIDRLVHHSIVLKLDVDNYRLKDQIVEKVKQATAKRQK